MFFFFNDTATTEIYTLSLHDALPIFGGEEELPIVRGHEDLRMQADRDLARHATRREVDELDAVAKEIRRVDRLPIRRSEEHTSELQSQSNLVCRLLLEKTTQRSRPPT